MKNETRNGIRLYFTIPCDSVMSFLAGKLVRAWPINPAAGSSGTISREHREKYFPKGGAQIRVDPDRVDVEEYGEYLKGVFTVQRKGVKNAKPAGKHDCSNFFCRVGRANDAKPKTRKSAGHRRRPLKTTIRVQLGANRASPSDPKLKTVEQHQGGDPLERLL